MINFWSERQVHLYAGCVTQFFLFALFIVTEGFLTAMAFMTASLPSAIPSPLHCPDVNTSLCSDGGWFLFLWLHHLSSSDHHDIYFILLCFLTIDHFYCEIFAPFRDYLVLISSPLKWLFSPSLNFIVFPTIIVIIVSYFILWSTVLKILSTKGRQKAFLHLQLPLGSRECTVWCCLFMYLTPDTYPELSKVASLCYTLLTPMLNPLWIYSLWETKMSKKCYTNFWRRKVIILWLLFSTNEWCLFTLYSFLLIKRDYSLEYHKNIIKSFLKVIYIFHILISIFMSIVKPKCPRYWRDYLDTVEAFFMVNLQTNLK